jgi:hypothetical protein
MPTNRKTTSRTKSSVFKDLPEMAAKTSVAKPPRPVLKPKNRGGAPKGNGNAWKTGFYTAERKDLWRRVRAFRHRVDAVLAALKDEPLPHRAEKSADR